MTPRPRKPQHRSRPPRPKPGSESGPRFVARGIRIIHEDDDLLIVEKPTGLITADPAAAGGRPAAKAGQTLFDILKGYAKDQPLPRTARPPRARDDPERSQRRPSQQRLWIIHRLDKEASGLLVFAKNEPTFRWLKEDLRAKRMHRLYLAVAEGIVAAPGESGTLQSFIRDDSAAPPRGSKRGRDRDDDDAGKLAVTHYRVLATGSNRTLLELRLETGRKNQIRIHLAEKGHPLVGDRRFGAKTDAIGRLALHAVELGLTSPATGQMRSFRSPAPASFYRCVGADPEVADTAGPTPESSPDARPAPRASTSWDQVAGWYDAMLEERGNDHYQQVILPGALRLLEPRPGVRILDVACGQGILARRLAALGAEVVGVEASPQLVDAARRRSQNPPIDAAPLRFEAADARELAALDLGEFDAAACIMALSNIDPLLPVMQGVAKRLRPGGAFVWIITHPAFRAPDQTGWGWDEQARRQYRRVDGYLSAGQKNIEMQPGKAARGGESVTTMTFHRPLQTYFDAMSRAGLLVDRLEEWPSLRASTSGPRAAEENRSRREIPLFLGVRARSSATALITPRTPRDAGPALIDPRTA